MRATATVYNVDIMAPWRVRVGMGAVLHPFDGPATAHCGRSLPGLAATRPDAGCF